MFNLIRPHIGRMVLAGLASLLVSALNGSLAWLVKPAVDRIFVEGQTSFLLIVSLAVFFAFLLRGIFEYSQNYLMKSIGAKIVRDYRNKLYEHMMYLPLSRFGTDSTGDLMSRVINDVYLFQELIARRVRDLFVGIGTVVFLAGLAFYRRWDLALISFTILPFAFYSVGRLGRRLKKVSDRTQKKIAQITEDISEGLSGIKIIKSFTTEERETHSFMEMNREYYREFMRASRIIEATTLIMDFVAGVGIGFIMYYGGFLVTNGTITTGDFFSFLTAIFLIYTPAKRIVHANNAFKQADASLDRIEAVFEMEKEPDGDISISDLKESVQYDNVRFKYETKDDEALKGVSFTIKKGEVIALVGRSGSGKTTIADLLARFYRPTGGRIVLDGKDINNLTMNSLRSLIGIVSQDVILFNDTVRANIAYGNPDATDEEVISAAKAAYAHDFIGTLPEGYNSMIGERGVRLSGGQRQRLSIARAILKNPPILILDEATSSLDTQSEMLVQKALENLMENRTTIVIAHRLSTIRRANRILVINDGIIVEEGSHDELIQKGGIYRNLHDLQIVA